MQTVARRRVVIRCRGGNRGGLAYRALHKHQVIVLKPAILLAQNQPQLLRGAAAAGLSAEDQANLAAGSDSVAVQQQAQDSSDDAVVAGAAGAAAFLAHSTRTVLRRGGAL